MAAALMAASARTAPKGRAVDSTASLVLVDDDLEKLALAMERKAAEKPDYLSSVYRRDANNVRNSGCVLLLGVTGEPKKIEQPLDCGACGFASCEHLSKARKKAKARDFVGPVCIFQAMDLGIALCSSAKLAAELGIDNRMMYTVGAAAKSLGLLKSDIIIGIPLSVTGKNPYFGRG
ncbi:MAG: hypothetical protein KKD83_00380 [Chloroflexi bacterium]|nr:hypothetical protein [Chloroflexota bacterium]